MANDLADIVQNADLQEWQEVFVVLCTFASREEFSGLAEQLGRRSEFQYTISKSSEEGMDSRTRALVEFRTHATLTYLAAARLERLVGIWVEEMAEEEAAALADENVGRFGSRYAAHAYALQTFIEKVTIFRSATCYTDGDLALASEPNAVEADAKTYKLAGLYDQYVEYAEVLASQGLLKEAAEVLKLTPADYKGSSGGSGTGDLEVARKRLIGTRIKAELYHWKTLNGHVTYLEIREEMRLFNGEELVTRWDGGDSSS